jgi:hypothetical protein
MTIARLEWKLAAGVALDFGHLVVAPLLDVAQALIERPAVGKRQADEVSRHQDVRVPGSNWCPADDGGVRAVKRAANDALVFRDLVGGELNCHGSSAFCMITGGASPSTGNYRHVAK